MKTILLISGVVWGLTSACGNNAEPKASEQPATESENGMDGTWKIVKADGMMADVNIGTEYIFAGKQLTLRGGGISTPGSYNMSKDTLIFTMKGYDAPMKYLHSMKGKQMVLKVVSSDQVFYLDKK